MFDYQQSFQRNFGVIRPEEREILRKTKIAILGVGGVGGRVVEPLVRLGCENILITDNGIFDPPDLNRQFSSNQRAIDRNKAENVKDALLEINPNLKLEVFTEGVTHENYKYIVDNYEIINDEIDINFGQIKQQINEYAFQQGKPIITSLLVGHGAVCILFQKGKGLSFDEYFGLQPDEDQATFLKKFVDGIYPKHTSDETYNQAVTALMEGKGHVPSSTANTFISGALVVMGIRSLLFNRPKIPFAPYFQQIDLFDMKYYVEKYEWQTAPKYYRT